MDNQKPLWVHSVFKGLTRNRSRTANDLYFTENQGKFATKSPSIFMILRTQFHFTPYLGELRTL